MRDVTSLKRSHERLMHDAVHDSLTGLPNRELFMDRVSGAITRAREGQGNRPTVLFIDIDRFKNVNKSFGLVIGDSMLLTLGRRLSRHLNPQDTLARFGGDQFAILLISESDPHQVATLAERVRRALRTPMKISGQGDRAHRLDRHRRRTTATQATAQDLLREGEIAMLRAKRGGADRIEIFNRLACAARTRAGFRSKAISGRRSRAPADRRAVPADHAARLQPARRLRGAPPLGPSDPRQARRRRLHPARRGDPD